MKKKRVLVAMSGGVDSSAAAAVLLQKGYEVEGAMMLLSPDMNEGSVEDARKVADRLGIKFHLFDLRDRFATDVIEPFCDMYLQGKTPNPCVICNKHIKFGAFLDRALEMGFDLIATGHYADIRCEDGVYRLCRTQSDKDQTYVLFNMTQHILAHTLFPLAEISDKSVVRKIAADLGLEVSDKPDSQEICFVPDKGHARFITERRGDLSVEGDFVDLDGKPLGRHKGLINYTVGQRKGLGISFGEPRFVTRLDAENNRVVLGKNEDCFSPALMAEQMNYISGNAPSAPLRLTAKVRYSAKDVPVTLYPDKDRARIVFDRPERAITAGQAVALYRDDEVIGGGSIVCACDE